MVKVFISNIDVSFGHNLSHVLSQTVVGARNAEEEEEDQATAPPPLPVDGTAPLVKEKPQKERYIINGTFSPDINALGESVLLPSYAKPGKMIETGDKKKDAARREAIEKIPTRGVKPKWVSDCAAKGDKEALLKSLLDSDVIIYDTLTALDEAVWAAETLAEMVDYFEKPKTFIVISTIMTWAKTKIDNDDPETPIPEDEYRRRKPHPNFKAYANLEKAIVKHSKKDKFKGYVIAPGLIYHAGDSIFHNFFKSAWHNEPFLTCYGDGTNVVPCIHLDDLISITLEVIESAPDAKYIVAIDDSKSTLFDIIKAISENLSNGIVKKVAKEEGFLDKTLSQMDYDMLSINLRLEPGWIKEGSLEMKYETGLIDNISQLIQEYKDARGLWPLKAIIHGAPASGKTYFSQKIAEHYRLHYIEVDAVIQETIANLERRVNGEAFEGEEVDVDGDRSTLIELKDALKSNNGKLPLDQLVELIRKKLNSMPCRNQGYVLDGYPTITEEAAELLKSQDEDARDDGKPPADEITCPDFVFSIEASDNMIKQRIMKLPESQVAGTRNSEEVLTKRLEEFRKMNTDELTVLNYFDELELNPITLQVEVNDAQQIFSQIVKQMGEPRNYGKSADQLLMEEREFETKQAYAESAAAEEREKKERQENERHRKITAEWMAKLEEVRKQERDTLEIQSEPLRNYLVKYVMPTLTAGLIEVAKVRPDDPVDYLAEFLFKQNPGNNNESSI